MAESEWKYYRLTGDDGLTGGQYLAQWNHTTTMEAPLPTSPAWRDTPYEADLEYKYVWVRYKTVPAGTDPSLVNWSAPVRQSVYEKWLKLSSKYDTYDVDRRGRPVSIGLTLEAEGIEGIASVATTDGLLSSVSVATGGSLGLTFTPSRAGSLPQSISVTALLSPYTDTLDIRLNDVTEYNAYVELTDQNQYESWKATGLPGDIGYVANDFGSLKAGQTMELYSSPSGIDARENTSGGETAQLLSALDSALKHNDGTIPENAVALNSWVGRLVANEAVINSLKARKGLFDSIEITGSSKFGGDIENDALVAVNGQMMTEEYEGTSTATHTLAALVKDTSGIISKDTVEDVRYKEGSDLPYLYAADVTDIYATVHEGAEQKIVSNSRDWSVVQDPTYGNSYKLTFTPDISYPLNGGKLTIRNDEDGLSIFGGKKTIYIVVTGNDGTSSFTDTYKTTSIWKIGSYDMPRGMSVKYTSMEFIIPFSYVDAMTESPNLFLVSEQVSFNTGYGVVSSGFHVLMQSNKDGVYSLSKKVVTTSESVTVGGVLVPKTGRTWNGDNITRLGEVIQSGSVTTLSRCSVKINGDTIDRIPSSVSWSPSGITFMYPDGNISFLRGDYLTEFSCSFTKLAGSSRLEVETILPKTEDADIGTQKRPFDEVHANKAYANEFHGKLYGELDGLLDKVYPVGSIYMSTRNVSPASFLGGRWTPLKDTFLLAHGDTYTSTASDGDKSNAEGGEASHTLTISETPSHYHTVGSNNEYIGDGVDNYNLGVSGSGRFRLGSKTLYSSDVGGGGSHNNMPPYLVVYMWKRIADAE